MKLWFLRITALGMTRSMVKQGLLAPILFKKIPLRECQSAMDGGDVKTLVKRIYSTQSRKAQGAHAGTLKRFLTEAAIGDVVGIKVNKDRDLIFAEFADGQMRKFPGFQKEGIKGRPIKLLSEKDADKVRSVLPESVTQYRGTFCLALEGEIDLPDSDERAKRDHYSHQTDQRQIKFIRVGTDLGCGQRLSRLFPGNYYHFIPIPKHNDPEFCRFTYGDGFSALDGGVKSKGRSLTDLRGGDGLVFYAGFDREKRAGTRKVVGIFAYLVVKEAFVFSRQAKKRVALRFDNQPRSSDPAEVFRISARNRSGTNWNGSMGTGTRTWTSRK